MPSVYVLPLISQVAVPLALLAWLWFAPGRCRAAALLRLFMTATYLVAIELTGLWLVVPWSLAIVYFIILVLAAYLIARRPVPPWPQQRVEWVGLALNALLAIAFAGLAGTAVRARWPPHEQIVDLEFPLRDGVYFVANGGNSDLINAHIQTLTAPRFRDYRGQSYGVDIVEVNSFGIRANGLVPRDPRAYVIFRKPIHAPCSGIVLRRKTLAPICPRRGRIVSTFRATSSSWTVGACTSCSATCSKAQYACAPASRYGLVLFLGTLGIRATRTSRTCISMRSVPRRTGGS